MCAGMAAHAVAGRTPTFRMTRELYHALLDRCLR